MSRKLIFWGIFLAFGLAAYDPLADLLERKDYATLFQMSRDAVIIKETARNYYYLAAAYTGIRRHRLAAKAYLLALDKPDLNHEMGTNIANYFENREDADTALLVYQKLFQKFPKEKVATAQKIVDNFSKNGKYQEVVEYFIGLLDDEDPATYNPYAYFVGLGYYQLGNLAEAENYFQKALKADCREIDLLLKQGELKVRKKEWQTGLTLISGGLQLGGILFKPEADTYKYLGQAYAGVEDRRNAADNLRKAIAAGNREEEVYLQYALNALQIRDFQGAIVVLEPRAETFAKSPDFQYYLGNAYDNLGQPAMAIQYYQKALEVGYRNSAYIRQRINVLSGNEE
ncbi:hypothetical protein NO2_0346 [Candidatus Termititenax persephonae]|uniref:Uncharacterized protein n=1 Tax=Candidatus Termititenax persephonae TaxID=2218525 RepID=A0A388THB7_9BACT|nr:hypothetical protein NO2_0346 [Candidatus Termititenax persephonae]